MNPTTDSLDFDNFEQRRDESRFAKDSALHVEFSRKPVLNTALSKEEGRAVYKEEDFIRIHVPGDKLTVIERPVDEIDARRFADRYARWKAGQGEAVVGTPVSALPGMTQAKVEEYRYFKVMTVEQLAEAPDGLGAKFMSFHEDKRRAKAFIEVAKGNAPLEKMQDELKARDAEIEEMKAQIASLQKLALKGKAEAA
jgi:hypothetical protein